MRIMTSNIWGNYFGNHPEERIDAIESTLKKYNADSIKMIWQADWRIHMFLWVVSRATIRLFSSRETDLK